MGAGMSEYRFAKALIKRSKPTTAKHKRMSNYGLDWADISKRCLDLANHVCRDCGSARANRAHHIVPLSKGGTNAQFNLKAICSECHKKYHSHLR